MEDWDMNLGPPEPWETVDELRAFQCENEECTVYDEWYHQEVEVHHWANGRETWQWTCIWCKSTQDSED